MFDRDTLVIGYDEKRGELRGKHKKGESWDGRGHCIDCTQCVQVCPMGIDIRDDLQMECIACGLCVDACNTVMDKVGLPRGLVRYDTLNHMHSPAQESKKAFKFLRMRTVYYGMILSLVGAAMLMALIMRAPLQVTVLHDRNPLFVQLSNGDVRNGYVVKILNKTHDHQYYRLIVKGLEAASIEVKAAGDVTVDRLYVPADSVGSYHVFVRANVKAGEPRDIQFVLSNDHLEDHYDSVFITRNK